MNLCVLASGKGSDLRAIYKAAKLRLIKSRIRIVISNNSKSGALKFSKQNNIPHYHLSQKLFNTESEFINEFLKLMKKYNIEMIVLAGYMKLLSPVIIRKYRNKIINVHPALLPAFGGKGMYGIHVHEAVIASGVSETGVTFHYVDEIYDHGPIILQKKVKVKPGDTPDILRKRVLRVEHKVYPEAIKMLETY
ncbi:MAG TPA: phosphoribosylglycinamide formyltransferase [Ignavibacteria bacterium]|nr:phosphoribosylglycinamide formyltransferase [Ignavibacteria bacterium]